MHLAFSTYTASVLFRLAARINFTLAHDQDKLPITWLKFASIRFLTMLSLRVIIFFTSIHHAPARLLAQVPYAISRSIVRKKQTHKMHPMPTNNSQAMQAQYVKIRCPKCSREAELGAGFTFVRCGSCDFEMEYGEYVRYIAHNNPAYSDILGDYAGATEGETAGTLDDWDEESN